MASLTDLPEEVLKLVMQLLPLKDRMTSCCLVSNRLHAAAVAATHVLAVSHNAGQIHPERVKPVLEWIFHFGQHLTQLQLSGFHEPWLTQLPCQHLRELSISYPCDVDLGPSDGYPGVVKGCPKLTRLELECSDIADGPEGAAIDSLSSLVHLQHLRVVRGHWRASWKVAGLSRATLPRLQHLTYLKVLSLSIENVTQLGALTDLQELHWELASDTAVGPKSVRGLAFPASLKKLSVASSAEVGVLSLLPTGLQDLQMACKLEGPGSFLSCIGRLQRITSLVMVAGEGFGPDWPPPGPAYSALTASSDLACLQLYNPPDDIWQVVFPATRNLPHLTSFTFAHDATKVEDVDYFSPPLLWHARDLSSLVSCCPNLCRIDGIWIEHGQDVAVLGKLLALTGLSVSYDIGELESIDESIQCLSGLPSLLSLRLMIFEDSEHFGLPLATFLPLTKLNELTSLECRCTPDQFSFRPECEGLTLISSVSATRLIPLVRVAVLLKGT
jgi:hypothetical protein